ncbi:MULTISPECIES: hypothetical protein [unclassified Corynebacterium]|uniref:hypothetical protein n=1 Tax=unclassified Corynebacterium TaxID=2624378 RepID=UPI0026559695|nr:MULTISPECIES: hypothetical protein [unclassified Corynebacterium]MDN8594045.1 hypothetical protein [Corynebacterium sp. P4_F2]WKK54935.1 hypothetical protein QYR03_06770 [Corynebacterium sp. P4-C1]WKK64331.1 hypothetical protein QYR04_05495 [Corynebacterium sp. P8-C1]
MEVSSTRFDDRSFDRVCVDGLSLSTVWFENCTITRPYGTPSGVSGVSLVDSELVCPEFGLRADWFATVAGSSLRDVVLEGSGAQFPILARVMGSTVTGEIRNVGFAEHRRYDQLDGVDLSGCALENVSFLGIPMERVVLSPEDKALVVEDWAAVADDVHAVAREGMSSSDGKVNLAAGELHEFIERDASLFRSAHGLGRPDGSLGYDERRGSRYVHEVVSADKPEWFVEAIRSLYREVGVDRLLPQGL